MFKWEPKHRRVVPCSVLKLDKQFKKKEKLFLIVSVSFHCILLLLKISYFPKFSVVLIFIFHRQIENV